MDPPVDSDYCKYMKSGAGPSPCASLSPPPLPAPAAGAISPSSAPGVGRWAEIYTGVLLLAALIYRAVVPLRGRELGTVSRSIGAKEGVLMAARRPPDARSVDVAGETADATGHDSCHSRRREEREGVRGRRKVQGEKG